MIAVIYSGSRNADWKLSDRGQIVSEFRMPGINPFLYDEKFISNLLNKKNELITYAEEIKRIYFYGAGATSKDRQQIIVNAFNKFFRYAKVTVGHDLTASAIATCGDQPAIVGILGSGSNAAYFNGKKIKENNFGMGYILADEGSANWLGRRLLKDYLTGLLPEKFEQKFVQKFNPERKQILDKVYRNPQPILFLTSFTDFLAENRQEKYVDDLVKNGFKIFFETYILPLAEKHPDLPVHFTGAIADIFQDTIKEMADGYGISVGNIIRKPIYNILNYYTNKN
ncbi:hypothetical protein [Pedobacter sp. SYSU D00535]|uniref:hypothetical protein n=1 Tax=Pedobacter sp. SYSU D00535 TaxID=2810308 RepID=UPI001A974EB2|nr:hypothetical protein [Pedobacter sp. SYSU D00535]